MAGPTSSGRKDGAASSTGRGRVSSGRPAPYRGRSSTGAGDLRARGRGRGNLPAARPGRGRGVSSPGSAASNTPRNKRENPSATASSDSPFAGLKQSKPFSSMFGGKASQQRGGTFGMPSNFDGTSVDLNRDPRRRVSARTAKVKSGVSIPVEDASVLNKYNERYEELKLDRARQREKAIKEGQMADPNQPTYLNQAITPVGTCTSMCPEYERVERIVQKMVDKSEKFLHPATKKLQNMETKMLKRFRRSAAGYDEQLPSDIRTPKTLLQTMNYLIRHVVGGNEPLGIIHKFVWDRTRSIRNDLSVQQLTQEDHVKMAVTCLERIARFHIVSLHLLSSPANEEPFDRHQEREQLNNTMLSLMYYYDDNRDRISFPNEDEFRAYYILFSIHDQRPDLEARVQKWPPELRKSPRVQVALEMFAAAGNTWEYQGTLDSKRPNAIAQGFYGRFFNLVDSPSVSYLMACVAEIYFNHMRQTAIRSIWKGYCRHPPSQQHKNEEWTVDELTTVLHFDDNDQTIEFCKQQDLEFKENSDGELCLNWGSRPIDSVAFQPSSEHAFSEKYVESKRAGRTLVAVILGLNVKEAAKLGMIDRSFLPQATHPLPTSKLETPAEDDSLFVSDDDNEKEALPPQENGIPEEVPIRWSPTSDSSLRNSFEELSQPAPGNEEAAEQRAASGISHKPNLFQPSDSTKTFSPSFAPRQLTSAVQSSASATPSPFAAFTSPFSLEKPQTSESSVISKASNTQQSSLLFPTVPAPLSATARKDDTTATISTPAFQFKFPTTPQTTVTTPAPPFSTATATLGTKSDGATGLTVGQHSASLFNSIQAPSLPATSPAPIFSFTDSKQTFKETHVQESPSEKETPAQTSLPPKAEPLIAKQNGVTFTSPSAEPVHTPPQPIPLESKAPTAPTAPTVVQAAATQEQTAEVTAQVQEDSSTIHPPPAQPAVSEVVTGEDEDSFASLNSSERRRSWIKCLKDVAERRRQEHLANQARRKRALDDDQEPGTPQISSKVLKVSEPKVPEPNVSEPNVSRRRRSSLAHYSVTTLPKLPILDKIESLISRKPAPEPKSPGLLASQIDKDEILLSAARIAAEALRTGPKIFDGVPAYPDPLRSSFGPHTSRLFSSSQRLSSSLRLSSSQRLSRSESPLQSRVHGYDVALAPDTDLGLGCSLSRTEQRIRATGGKGLAYKPLDLTPEKKTKTKGYSSV